MQQVQAISKRLERMGEALGAEKVASHPMVILMKLEWVFWVETDTFLSMS